MGRLGSGPGRAQMNYDMPDPKRARIPVNFPDPKFFDVYETLGEHELISPPANNSVIYEDLSSGRAVRLGTYDMGEGTWTFDEVGTSAGDRVVVRFQATLYRGL